MNKHGLTKLLVVGLLVLVLGIVGAGTISIVSADEPVGERTDCECPTGYASCRRSDCPCGASWQECECVQLVAGPCVCRCWCECDTCDAVVTPNGIGAVHDAHPSTSFPGTARIGFWGGSEYGGWLRFSLANFPERKVGVAAVVLKVNTQWLATDENAALVVELVDAGPSWPRDYADLNWPVTVKELLRLTTWEVSEMVNYYGEPVRFAIPPDLLEGRIAQKRSLAVRFRFEGARENNLLDVSNAGLYIKWTN